MIFDVKRLIKYLLEGLAVAVAAFYIPQKKVDPYEIGLIALTGAAIFMVLDYFAPAVAGGARAGAGFGVGFGLVGGADDQDDDLEGGAESTDADEDADGDGDGDDDAKEPVGKDSGEGFASVI